MKFYPMHMHLHASHEPTASIGSHMAHAAQLGIHHIWITEHDVRMGRKFKELSKFYFPKKELFCEFNRGVRAGFKHLEGSSGKLEFCDTDDGIALDISVSGDERELIWFYSRGKNHCDPLFSGVTVKMDAELNLSKSSEFYLEFVLSAQPPSYEHSKLVYVMGAIPENEEDNVSYLPFPKKGEDGKYTFPITKDVTDKVGGLDNSTCFIRILLDAKGESAHVRFKTFEFLRELNFEPVRQNQIKVANEVGKRWGVTPFVTYEISDAGHHKNCYTTSVPVLNYEELNYNISQEYAINHVKSHGGIFCYNHPFTEWKNDELDKDARAAVVEKLIIEFTKNRVFGATLMEVGFPYEKEGFYDDDYLRLWDGLSKNGVFITGDGDSDNHHATSDGWTEGNNFATFAGISDEEEPDEKSITDAFKRGSVWCGNPVLVNNMSFTAGGAQMGAVIVGKCAESSFSVNGVKCSGEAVAIVNGKEVKRVKIKDGFAELKFDIPCNERFNFGRVELRDENGILTALSNPIYVIQNEEDIYPEAQMRRFN